MDKQKDDKEGQSVPRAGWRGSGSGATGSRLERVSTRAGIHAHTNFGAMACVCVDYLLFVCCLVHSLFEMASLCASAGDTTSAPLVKPAPANEGLLGWAVKSIATRMGGPAAAVSPPHQAGTCRTNHTKKIIHLSYQQIS